MEPSRSRYQHVLEITQVSMDVTAASCQVKERISDQLSRAMVRNVAAAVGADELDRVLVPVNLH